MSTTPSAPSKRRRTARAFLFVVLCLTTAVMAFYIFEGWRGRRAWAQYRAEAQARGIKLDWLHYAPPELPAENNFASLPLFAGLEATPSGQARPASSDPFAPSDTTVRFPKILPLSGQTLNFEQDWPAWQRYFVATKMAPSNEPDPLRAVLSSLERFRPTLEQLSEGTKRSGTKLSDDGWHLSSIGRAQLWWWLRAKAQLANGDASGAYQDINALLRLRRVLESEPRLICALIRGNTVTFACDLVCDGLSRDAWSNPQLEHLQKQFGELRLIEDAIRGWNAERAAVNLEVERLAAASNAALAELDLERGYMGDHQKHMAFVRAALYPRGWFYHHLVLLNRLYDRRVAQLDAANRRIDFTALDWLLKQELLDSEGDPPRFLPRLSQIYPEGDSLMKSFGSRHTAAQEVTVACALERFRRAHAEFPKNLAELIPDFLPSIPTDVVDGAPLRYQKNDAGGYELWSIGIARSWSKGDPVSKDAPADPRWMWRIDKPPQAQPIP